MIPDRASDRTLLATLAEDEQTLERDRLSLFELLERLDLDSLPGGCDDFVSPGASRNVGEPCQERSPAGTHAADSDDRADADSVGDLDAAHRSTDGPVEFGRFVTLGRNVEFLEPMSSGWSGGASGIRDELNPAPGAESLRVGRHGAGSRPGSVRRTPPHSEHAARWRTGAPPASRSRKRTVVGPDAWIGAGSLVLGGVVIGAGSVIAPGSVVVGDVEPYAIVEGRPATRIGWRFEPALVRELLAIRWWDWPDALIRDRSDWFLEPIAEFVRRCRAD